MTVLSQSNKMSPQNMNGVATQFSFSFRALVDVEEAIKAVITEISTSTDTELILNDGGVDGYTVTIDEDGVGGYITVNDARSVDFTITIYREYEETQISNYADYNSFPAETVEDDYDKGTMIDQQLSETLTRTLVLPITVTGVDTTLPVPEAGRPIGWNDTADGLTNYPSLVYQLQVDVDATPDYLGAGAGDGVLRVNTANISYADGGDFITLDTVQNIGATASPTFAGLTLTTLTMTQAVNIILDEDDLVSDRDDALATQQSIKAYVDAGLAGTFADPMTTRGDIIIRDATNVTARLGIGANGTVLTSDGTDVSWQAGGGGGSASTVTYDVNQVAHGFSVGDVLRHNGTSYTEAQADSETNAEAIGIVSAVTDVDNFTLQMAGRITGLSGLTAGGAHFLDASTAGALTATAPTTDGEVTKPILVADSTTSGYVYNMRGLVVGSGGGGGGTSLTEDINQVAHGLSVGDWVRLNGTSYVTAQADSVANAEAVGVVSAVADVDNFTLQFGGKVTGLSGLSADDVYYIDETTAGAITNTAPTAVGEVVKPMLIADSATSGYIFNMRGNEIATAPATVVGISARASVASGGTLIEGYNVASTSLVSTGVYQINFTNAFANATYTVTACPSGVNIVIGYGSKTTTSCRIHTVRRVDGAVINSQVDMMVVGTLA